MKVEFIAHYFQYIYIKVCDVLKCEMIKFLCIAMNNELRQ